MRTFEKCQVTEGHPLRRCGPGVARHTFSAVVFRDARVWAGVHNLLEWNGTEQICKSIPEMDTTLVPIEPPTEEDAKAEVRVDCRTGHTVGMNARINDEGLLSACA